MIFMEMFAPRVEVMIMEITEIMEIKLKFSCPRKRETVSGYVKGQCQSSHTADPSLFLGLLLRSLVDLSTQ
jgi:hypothetical protein